MPKIRILVVDDSVVFRRLVSEELSATPRIEVVGTAANGRIALAKLAQVSPDLVVLDVEMPEMDGLETLKEIRKTHPRLPVIMFSALTERGAEATLDALALGATDYFTKPTDAGGLEASLRVIREELIPKIKALCAAPARRRHRPPPTVGPRRGRPAATGRSRCWPSAASTGGPNALTEIFSGLPADFPVPILVVQHMPPMFTRLLAERLSAQSPIRVQEASSGCLLEPGEAWIAPGDHHMVVVAGRPPVPPPAASGPAGELVPAGGRRALALRRPGLRAGTLAVILTGMGQDGLRGCEALREAGGQVLAQDEATSVVWGMPGFVAQAGLADRVLPLSMIAGAIVERVRP